MHLKSLAQLAQEDLRASLIGLQDEIGMGLDVTGALVAAQRLGREVPQAPCGRIVRPCTVLAVGSQSRLEACWQLIQVGS